MSIRESILSDHPRLTALRHELHEHPEVMYEEVWTSERVKKEIDRIGIPCLPGLAGGTGILAHLPATKPGGKTVALRADMDALPIREETGLPYASKIDGKMHACGHDGHTTILIGALGALAQESDRPNDILFLFQPAEEGGAGGQKMVQEGALDGSRLGKPADVIYGLHGWPEGRFGEITVRNGPMLAATDEWTVVIRGKGGHAAAPHLSQDPVVAAAQVIVALQSIVSRNADPLDSLVFTTGAIHAGQAHNVIPDTVELKGTMRTLKPETRVMGEARFRTLVTSVSEALGCHAEIIWNEGYPVTFNDPWATDRFRTIVRDFVGEDLTEKENPVMGGEDFSYYGQVVPACFCFVGLRREGDEKPAGLHTPRFDFNDAIIPRCVEMFCRLATAPVKN
ncbi:MAG: amidohydrolase [Fimbriimonadaceae bacterium]|nr:amidohydrolase [Fimbriimonadaceae bacterium]